MDTTLQIIFFILLGISALIYGFWLFNTERRLKRLFAGKKGKDLEDAIREIQNQVEDLKKSREAHQAELGTVNQKLRKSIRGVDTVRFNPFPDQGGNQSFAIGMLTEEGNGVVISSLYARDRMSIFAKPIKNKKSEYELTAEEKQALRNAEVK